MTRSGRMSDAVVIASSFGRSYWDQPCNFYNLCLKLWFFSYHFVPVVRTWLRHLEVKPRWVANRTCHARNNLNRDKPRRTRHIIKIPWNEPTLVTTINQKYAWFPENMVTADRQEFLVRDPRRTNIDVMEWCLGGCWWWRNWRQRTFTLVPVTFVFTSWFVKEHRQMAAWNSLYNLCVQKISMTISNFWITW